MRRARHDPPTPRRALAAAALWVASLLQHVAYCAEVRADAGDANGTGPVQLGSGSTVRVACAHGETFNPATGYCACLHGYSGRDCSAVLHPACFLEAERPGGEAAPRAALCTAVGALSCACLEQCFNKRTAPAYAPGPCYVRADPGATLSAVPALDEPGVTWLRSWRDNGTAASPAEVARNGAGRFLPPAACPGGCGGNGLCVDGAKPRCECFPGHAGGGCETADARLCMQGCSGRGTCVRGVCVCQPGWYGWGCADSVNATAADRPASTARRLALFIWCVCSQPKRRPSCQPVPHGISAS